MRSIHSSSNFICNSVLGDWWLQMHSVSVLGLSRHRSMILTLKDSLQDKQNLIIFAEPQMNSPVLWAQLHFFREDIPQLFLIGFQNKLKIWEFFQFNSSTPCALHSTGTSTGIYSWSSNSNSNSVDYSPHDINQYRQMVE